MGTVDNIDSEEGEPNASYYLQEIWTPLKWIGTETLPG
jgi:hypothetical protein